MRLALAAAVLLLAGAVGRAEALTIRDVIELTKAGVSEEVLLALIDVDVGVYAGDTETLKALKEAGVSERVMVALVRSGRERRLPEPMPPPPPQDEAPAPAPQVVVVEHHEPQVQQVVVPVPVYVPVYTTLPRARAHRDPYDTQRVRTGDFAPSNYVPFQPAPPVIRQEVEPTRPVYWGFGGKRRPDAWDPSPWEREPASDGDRKPATDRKPAANPNPKK
jgi:hypothetical protein